MKILIADDSIVVRLLLSASLRKLKHEVVTATNGQEAIDLFKTNKPDLIILDILMGSMDGFECARKIRALDPEDWVPIIFLSGMVNNEDIAKGIDAGGDDYLTKPYDEIILAAKIKAMQRIANMRQKLFTLNKQLSTLLSTDTLTGIYNRLQFEKVIVEKIADADKRKTKIALLFMDLDNFKLINDSLGHHVGDLLLKEVATRLKFCLRENDFIARIGGDEFAVILSDLNTFNEAGDIANKLINVLSPSFKLADNEIHIGSSIGIACYTSAEIDEKTLIQNADAAMYHAKKLGRNNFQYFNQNLTCYEK